MSLPKLTRRRRSVEFETRDGRYSLTTFVVFSATSYTGSAFCRRQLGLGHSVLVVTREGQDLNRLGTLVNLGASTVSSERIGEIGMLEGESFVLCYAGMPVSDHVFSDISPLVDSLLKVPLQAMQVAKTINGKLILMSSYWKFLESDSQIRPINLYAALGSATDQLCHFFARDSSNWAIMHLADTYGPNDFRPKIVNTLLRAARSGRPVNLGGPDQTMAPIYIDDVTSATEKLVSFMKAGRVPLQSPLSYQLLPERLVTLAEMIEACNDSWKVKLNVRWEAMPTKRRGNITKILRNLPNPPQWKQKVFLAEGLTQLWKAGHDS